ncbi:unnamed protein product [Dibothriocephalus latus]|uniref:Desmoplakin SH3 domain-containing protein n=1 Tax=Dibothriocephalus latus TaxID=60516 RepID=A0A3P7LBF1_DIBLA|nr:unnamed protein product [Dibothriocephalus latus]
MEYIGDTHQALQEEMDRQVGLEADLAEYTRRGIFSAEHYAEFAEQIDVNQCHLEYLAGSTGLEKLFSNLSRNIRSNWKTIQMFSLASRVHICNAAEYQMFYYISDHMFNQINNKTTYLYQQAEEIASDDNYTPVNVAERLTALLNESLKEFQSMSSEILKLIDKAHKVSPVYQRIQPLDRPTMGMMLCDYKTTNFSLRAGQQVIVMDNNMPTPSSSSDEIAAGSTQTESTTTTTTTSMGTQCVCMQRPISPSHQAMPGDRSVTDESTTYTDETECSTDETSHCSGTVTCSSTTCMQKEARMWKVRTPDCAMTMSVPSVAIWLCETDRQAIDHSFQLAEHFVEVWSNLLDSWLVGVINMFSRLFINLEDAEHIHVESQAVLNQLFEELDRAFPGHMTGQINQKFTEILTNLRQRISTEREDSTFSGEVQITTTEIATYRKVLRQFGVSNILFASPPYKCFKCSATLTNFSVVLIVYFDFLINSIWIL